jgi:hypothetical protein
MRRLGVGHDRRCLALLVAAVSILTAQQAEATAEDAACRAGECGTHPSVLSFCAVWLAPTPRMCTASRRLAAWRCRPCAGDMLLFVCHPAMQRSTQR